jgi:hypothetical protein
MFTLEQKIFIVQCYFRNGERLKNGEWSYSTPRVFEEFQQKFPDFQGTYKNLPESLQMAKYRVILNDCSRSRPCSCYYVFAAFM